MCKEPRPSPCTLERSDETQPHNNNLPSQTKQTRPLAQSTRLTVAWRSPVQYGGLHGFPPRFTQRPGASPNVHLLRPNRGRGAVDGTESSTTVNGRPQCTKDRRRSDSKYSHCKPILLPTEIGGRSPGSESPKYQSIPSCNAYSPGSRKSNSTTYPCSCNTGRTPTEILPWCTRLQ
jgi:hypothetical protein